MVFKEKGVLLGQGGGGGWTNSLLYFFVLMSWGPTGGLDFLHEKQSLRKPPHAFGSESVKKSEIEMGVVWPVRMHAGAILAYRYVGDSNTAGGAGLCEAEALHHRAAEAHFEELLHMVGQGGTPRHNEPDAPPQPGLDLGKHQLVEEGRSLQRHAAVMMSHGAWCDEVVSWIWVLVYIVCHGYASLKRHLVVVTPGMQSKAGM